MEEVGPPTALSWLSRGWMAYRYNLPIAIPAAGIWALVTLPYQVARPGPMKNLVMLLVYLTVGIVLQIGWLHLFLKLVRSEPARISDILSGFSRFRSSWATGMLFGLIVIGGTFLLIVPGIYWALKYLLSLFAVLDRPLSARESLGYSARITDGHKWKLLAVLLILAALSLLSLPFGMGWTKFHAGAGGHYLIVIGFIPYLVCVLVVMPWGGATLAAAYDSLAAREAQETTGVNL